MTVYNVIITPDAENDLNEIDDYITLTLHAPDTAIAYLKNMRERILSLQSNPYRFHLFAAEPWHALGIHRMNVKGFAVFYSISEEYREVYIQNIIYQRRDIQRILLDFYNFSEES